MCIIHTYIIQCYLNILSVLCQSLLEGEDVLAAPFTCLCSSTRGLVWLSLLFSTVHSQCSLFSFDENELFSQRKEFKIASMLMIFFFSFLLRWKEKITLYFFLFFMFYYMLLYKIIFRKFILLNWRWWIGLKFLLDFFVFL